MGTDHLVGSVGDSLSQSARRPQGKTVMIVVVVGCLLYLIMGPLAMLVGSSLQRTETGLPFSSSASWSLENYRSVFGQLGAYADLARTLMFSAGALAIAFGLSVPFAWLIERTDLPLRNLCFVLLVATSGMPALITAIAWTLLLNPTNGIVNALLPFTLNIYSMGGMIFVQGMGMVPLTFLLLCAAIRGVGSNLEDAASAAGARRWRVLRTITLPLATPALLGTLVYLMVNVIDTLDVPLVLGLNGGVIVLSTRVYLTSHPPTGLPDYGSASVYSLFMLAIVILPLAFYNRLIGRAGAYATIGGRGVRRRRMELGRWRVPALAPVFAYVGVAFVLPLFVLVWVSIQPVYRGVSLEAFRKATIGGYVDLASSQTAWKAFMNTFILGIAVGLVAVVLGMFTSWIVVRTRARAVALLDVLAFMPHAYPGVMIGLSVLLIYLYLPLPIYGTLWIVVIALGTQEIALATRLTNGGVVQIQENLEKAAAVCGAMMRTTWRRVMLPLLRPTLINAFLLVFLASIQNLTLPLMLQAPGNTVVSTLLWGRWYNGQYVGAAVLSVCLLSVAVVAAVLMRKATREV